MSSAQIVTSEQAATFVTPVVSVVVSQAQKISVASPDDYEFACIFLQQVAGKKKQVEEVFRPIVTKAHEAHKEACAQMKRFLDPLLMAETAVKQKVSTWRTEEERKRREEEARQAAILRAEAEAAALAEAAQLEASGEKELAEIVLQNAAEAPAPVVVLASSVPQSTGVSGREVWKWRARGGNDAEGLRALVQAAAKDDRLLAYLCFNEKTIGAAARTQKTLMKVPGVEVFKENTVSVRAS